MREAILKTYSFTPDLLERFEAAVPAGERSDFIRKAVARRLAEVERRRARASALRADHEQEAA